MAQALQELPVNNSLTNAFAEFLKTTQGSKTNTQGTSGSPLAASGIDATIAQLMQSLASGEFSKSAADKDSMVAVESIFTQFKDQVLPQIFQAQNASGGYNSTTAQLLSNDAFSRAVSQASALKLKTATDYAQAQIQTAQAISNAAQTSSRLVENKTQTTVPTTNLKSNPLGSAASILGIAAKAAPFIFPNKTKEVLAKGTTRTPRSLKTADFESIPDLGITESSGDFLGPATGANAPNVQITPLPDSEILTTPLEPVSTTDSFAGVDAAFSGIDATTELLSTSGLADITTSGINYGSELAGAFETGIIEDLTVDQISNLGTDVATDFLTEEAAIGVGEAFAEVAGSGSASGGFPGIALVNSIGNDSLRTLIADNLLDSVICTHLYNQGLLDKRLYFLDVAIAALTISKETKTGYHIWAKPCVSLMKKFPTTRKFFLFFVLKWLNQLCYDYFNQHFNIKIQEYKSTTLGKFMRKVGEPLCKFLGSWKCYSFKFAVLKCAGVYK